MAFSHLIVHTIQQSCKMNGILQKALQLKKNDVMSLKVTSFFDVSTIVVNVTFLNNLVDETKVQNLVLKYPVMFWVCTVLEDRTCVLKTEVAAHSQIINTP